MPLAVIGLNYFPIFYLGLLGAAIWQLGTSPGAVAGLVLFWIYLLPPLVCRLVLLIWGEPQSPAAAGSPSFRKWWLLTQLQMVFNRFPALEEALRLVPSLYSLWLCLWGSKVSTLVLWSPGVRVADRYLLQIDSQVVLGWGAKLSSHLVSLDGRGESELISGRIVVGEGAIIGGLAVLGPGSRVYPGESFPATRVLGPFHTFKDGRRDSGSAGREAPGGVAAAPGTSGRA